MPGAFAAQRGIVIVGAGHAGCQVASSLRDLGYSGDVTLIGDEPHLPYQRPPLSKAFLDGTASAASLALRAESFFEKASIVMRRDVRVTAIDRGGKIVRTKSGEQLPYDHLVLATGARNRKLDVPGAHLRDVLQLRSLADAEGVRDALKLKARIVIVGAGFIGLELAAFARSAGHHVDIVELSERPLARAVSEPISDFYRKAHESAGVAFHFGQHVARIHGENGRVVGVELSNAALLPADVVLVGIGVLPNDDLAQAAGLATANGICADDTLLTEDPSISAIGDCASYPQPFADHVRMRIESVQNAVDQARCVAARLTGKPDAYNAVPWFWSDQGNWKLQIAGVGLGCDQTVLRGDPASGAFSAFCFQHGRLKAVESVNKPGDHMLARRLIAQRIPISPESVADLSVDLKALLNNARVAA